MADKLRPRTLAEYVGQRRLIDRLMVEVEAALLSERPLPHLLLTAPPGTGKTTLAYVLAHQVGDRLVELTMPADVKALERHVAEMERGILFLDEIQEAGKVVQARLLRLMEHGVLPLANGTVIANENITIIGATTDPGKIRPALYDRFMVPSFEPYSIEDMAAIVAGMAAKAGLELAPATCEAIGRAANGAPRYALRMVEAARSLSESLFGMEPDVESIFAQAGFTPDGLTDAHLDYLEALAMLEAGGGTGLPLLARHLRLDQGVCMDLERLLIRHHLIEYSGQGRRLSPLGRRRIRDHLENAA